ncbi:MAG: hemolysin III family protein [Candidatus Hydrogenedentes bacterium]|nr:hemolysin III family protein [Candidatus Hydrogenedentota bacterium]
MNHTVVTSKQLREELANSITHGIGFVLSVAGLVILVVSASIHGDPYMVVSFSVYGASLVVLYLASTFYHSFHSPRLKHYLRIIDHCAIYLLIAGTYTPFTLLNLRGPVGWTLFGTIWALAAIGIVLKWWHIGRFPILTPLIYVAMGWVGAIAVKPSIEAIPPGGMQLLVAGGVTYTVGVIFYALEKLPYNHAIWHMFVLSASAMHFFAILFYAM